jgi:hypothetical protein
LLSIIFGLEVHFEVEVAFIRITNYQHDMNSKSQEESITEESAVTIILICGGIQ